MMMGAFHKTFPVAASIACSEVVQAGWWIAWPRLWRGTRELSGIALPAKIAGFPFTAPSATLPMIPPISDPIATCEDHTGCGEGVPGTRANE